MKFLVLQHINIEHPGIFLNFMKEDEIQIDHLKCKRKGTFDKWVRPGQDDDVQPILFNFCLSKYKEPVTSATEDNQYIQCARYRGSI